MRASLPVLALVIFLAARAASASDAQTLLQKAEAVGASTTNWRAEVVERSVSAGYGTTINAEIRTAISAQAPLKLRRENSGEDKTVLICNGTKFYYSGDGHSYYMGDAKTNPDCSFPLESFYKLKPAPISVSLAGHDHVSLRTGDRACEMVQARWSNQGNEVVRTLCIDPTSGLILRAVTERSNGNVRSSSTITFLNLEIDPVFPPDTFTISPPPGQVEAKPPI